MKQVIDVFTGEVKSGGHKVTLKSNAIGSCIVVAAYVPTLKVGAMAHIMLPGSAPQKKKIQQTRYAENAIKELINQLVMLGSKQEKIEACLIGAGNVLKRCDDTICSSNILSVENELHKRNILVKSRALGGMVRRTASFDIEKGRVYYTEDDSKEMLLCKFTESFVKVC